MSDHLSIYGYYFAENAIAQKFKDEYVNKNESYDIKPMMNGFKVSYDYRLRKDGDSEFSYDYVSEEFMFKDWAEVASFIELHPLQSPPTKL